MDYESSLDRAFDELPELSEQSERLQIPDPVAQEDGAFTRLTNLKAVADALSGNIVLVLVAVVLFFVVLGLVFALLGGIMEFAFVESLRREEAEHPHADPEQEQAHCCSSCRCFSCGSSSSASSTGSPACSSSLS